MGTRRIKGKYHYLDFPSVGATENILMAAVTAKGRTIIENAAEEPEIVDLVTFLNGMGANIKGAGTNVIRIEGVKELYGVDHTVIPDRIEAGTFMIAAAMVGGDVLISNVLTEHLKPLLAKLNEAGVKVVKDIDSVRVISDGKIRSTDIKTLPYPGFPTDLQAQFMALMTIGDGLSRVTETVFENRFMHVGELQRMGAFHTGRRPYGQHQRGTVSAGGFCESHRSSRRSSADFGRLGGAWADRDWGTSPYRSRL